MLSEHDVQLLLQEKSSPAARAEIAGKVASTLATDDLTPAELTLAKDIIGAMVRDVAVEVRQALAENLKASEHMPREVAFKLAQDVDQVALPILEFSSVLTDEDLLKIIRLGSDGKHQAIARRETVSATVADSLVNTASEQAVQTLMSNRGAEILENSMQKAIDRFPQSEGIQASMVERERLPLLVAERLVSVVSDKLRDHLMSRHELRVETVTDAIMAARERAIISLSTRAGEIQDVEQMVAQMHAGKRLTPNLVMRALCMGDVAFFEASLAVMSNVPIVNARLLIHDAGRLGLKSLYEKAGMPLRLLPAVRVALDVIKDTQLDGGENDLERFKNRVIERILTQYEDLSEDDIEYLISKIGDSTRASAAA